MRKPFALVRPGLFGRLAPDPAGGRPMVYASDLFLIVVAVLALVDIAPRLFA